jgi:hypothetical protein
MSEAETKENLAAPTDAPPAEGTTTTKKKRRKPRRFQLFDDGQGDFRICEVVPPGSEHAPAGALIMLPELGGYPSATEAKQGLRKSGQNLTGKQIMIVRAVEIVSIQLETKPRVLLESKPRKQVSGPTPDAEPAAASA